MSERDITVDVTDAQVREMEALGFWREEDGILVLTNAGNAWVSEWCAKRIAEAE